MPPAHGHLFPLQLTLPLLTCDSALVPTDEHANPHPSHLSLLPSENEATSFQFCDSTRLQHVSQATNLSPDIFIGYLNPSSPKPNEWYISAFLNYLDFAYETFVNSKRSPLFRRAIPLFAVPYDSDEKPGLKDKGLLRDLYYALFQWTRTHVVDVAIVLGSSSMFRSAQRIRGRHLLQTLGSKRFDDVESVRKLLDYLGLRGHTEKSAISDRELKSILRLSKAARNGNLAVFAGAGLSAASGIPTWWELLKKLGGKVGVNGQMMKGMEGWNAVDVAQLIAKRYEDAGEFRREIAEEVGKGQYLPALGHAIVCGYGAECMMTTNYDRLLEKCVQGMGGELLRLGEAKVGRGKKWLLKLHGSVEEPGGIVLTREDYYKYARSRMVLLGIVAAVLVMKEVLVVGFGLEDENFHLVVRELRGGIGGGGRLATAVMAKRREDLRELWGGDVEVMFVPGECSEAELYRRHDVLLDVIGIVGTEGNSDDGSLKERELKRRLREILDEEEELGCEGFRRLKRFCGELGKYNKI